MSISGSDFSKIKKFYIGAGCVMVKGRYKPSGTYTSGGETLTNAIINQWGLHEIFVMNFGGLHKGDQSAIAFVTMDGNSTSTTQGKIHVWNADLAHTHDMKAIGGLTSSEALFLDASQKFGKNAATDRTIVGSTSATTGGVVSSAAATTGTEAAAGTDYSTGTFYADFVAFGR